MSTNWWQRKERKHEAAHTYPTSITCPSCRSDVLADMARLPVIIRVEAHCDHCGGDICLQYKVQPRVPIADITELLEGLQLPRL